MGAHVSLCLAENVYKERARLGEVYHFLKCIQDFYIEAAVQIRKRFPLRDPVMKMLQVIDPKTSMSFLPSLPLASRFSNILLESKIQQLDSEW